MQNNLIATISTATAAKEDGRGNPCPAKRIPMTPIEGSEEHPAEQEEEGSQNRNWPIEISIRPFEGEAAAFRRTPGGGYTIFLRGEIRIDIHPPAPDAAKSPVRADFAESGTQIPETPVQARTEPASAPTEEEKTEEGNEKYVFVGNPVRDPSYWVRKSGKRVADFILATNPAEDDPGYRRIRAFDDLAEKVRDQVRKGQTGIEATVYGPKHWISRYKTKQGWEEREVTGYYAGFVKVPKRYRQGEAHSGQ
jgi:hypothetical protein